MYNAQLIAALQREMQHAGSDIKAEAQLLLALEHGIELEHFMVSCDNSFKREYSRDVVSSELKEDEGGKQLLQIHLSRNGIYDQLPEGLFFQSPQRATGATVADMASDHRLNKKREEEIRRFFLPFENDFFLQRLAVEREETMLLEGLQSGILNDYFIQFWDLPSSIPKPLLAPLIVLLPYAYKIAGDVSLTGQSLQEVLREQVTVTMRHALSEDASSVMPPAIGMCELGLDMVCGHHFMEDTPVMEIEIGPLINSRVSEYLETGNRHTLMETFERFFIPAGVDTTITIKMAPEDQQMILEKEIGSVLGYSSFLG
jgi:hypothetical protein